MAEKTLKVTAAQIEESVEKSHNHSNLSTLNNITSSRMNEWDDKADKEHRHNASEIDGLDNLDVDLSNYYTKTQVDNKIATEIDSIDLSDYAKKSEIPNATSDLTNDSNFATQSFVTSKIAEASLSGGNVDLSGYATKDELNTKANVSAIPTKTSQLTNDSNYLAAIPNEYVTETELNTSLSNKVDKEAGKGLSTNDLTNEMVTKINNAATQAYVTNAIAEAQLEGSDVDLSGLATKDELNTKADISAVPTKTSQLTNDSGFITTIPSEVITETELNAKSYATETFVTSKIAEASLSGGNVDLSSYATKEYVDGEIDNISIPTKLSELQNDKNFIVDGDEINATSLNGKKFSEPMTKQEYDAIVDKDPNTIYLVDDDTTIEGIPSYSSTEANKVLAVNSNGTALAWIDAPSGSGTGLTDEQVTQLATAYEHSQSIHVQIGDIPTKTSQLINNSLFATETYVNGKIAEASISGGSIDFSSIILSGGTFVASKGNIIISKSSINITEGGRDTFTVALDKAPTNTQTVELSVDNLDVVISPTSLNFTESDYNTPQTVNINILEDDSDYSDETAIITLSSLGIDSKTISVNITDNDEEPQAVSVTGVTLSDSSLTLKTGDIKQLTYNIEPKNATNQSVYWESSKTSVAEVDTNGKVTIKATGETIITCRTDDGGFTATCSITVEQGEIADSLAINFDARGKTGLSIENLVDSVTGAYINVIKSGGTWVDNGVKLNNTAVTNYNITDNSSVLSSKFNSSNGYTIEICASGNYDTLFRLTTLYLMPNYGLSANIYNSNDTNIATPTNIETPFKVYNDSGKEVILSSLVNFTQMTHYAIVGDTDGNVKFYFNGYEVSTAITPNGVFDHHISTIQGHNQFIKTKGDSTEAILSYIRVHNRALTKEEIKSNSDSSRS